MKKITLIVIFSLFFILFNCNKDIDFTEDLLQNNLEVLITESSDINSEDTEEHCTSVNLIAGQHHIAGVVTINIDGDYLIITYQANSDWTIDATHLHITNCEEGGFPLTGADNPKIGNFEYSSTHEDGTNTVVYSIPLSEVTETYCFAAHAEVSGPSSETAWAEGTDFGGNSWAMYIEGLLSDCDDGDDDGGGVF